MFLRVSDLKRCLEKKGWKKSETLNKQFMGGYPFFYGNNNALIATEVIGNNVKYCSHNPVRCDTTANLGQSSYIYYYL